MTPAEVRSLTAPEYIAFAKVMDAERRERERQQRKRKR